MIVGPVTVVVAHLLYPLRMPDGFTLYKIETTSGRYFAIEVPLVRDAEGRRMVLDEELWTGSVVKLALNERGLIYAVQVLTQTFVDPFASAVSQRVISG